MAAKSMTYQERKFTLCGQLDVKDEYHLLFVCLQYSSLREMSINYVNSFILHPIC